MARVPPTRTVPTAPNRSTMRSPLSRAAAMVRANAVVEAAATPGEPPSTSRR